MDRSFGEPCRVTAVVVTYNRKELLTECLQALLGQTVFSDGKKNAAGEAVTEETEKMRRGAFGCELEILVVDNASTDGTASFLVPLLERETCIHCMRLEENLGGAGGFCAGMKRAVEEGGDYVWIMDDDTIPKPQALEKLLEVASILEEDRGRAGFGFLSSEVLWTDGTLCRMNRQHFPAVRGDRQKELQVRFGIRPVDQATFVSLLFPADVIGEMGLPIREYFIWGDDKEYTLRLAAAYPCYYVPESVVVHKMGQNTGSNITFDDIGRISRYFYAYRNDLATAKRRGLKDILIYFAAFGLNMARILIKSPDHKRARLAVMWKGMLAGVRFSPGVEFAERKQRYDKGDII